MAREREPETLRYSGPTVELKVVTMKRLGRDRLEDLPAIGPSIAADLRRLGITHPRDLAAAGPAALYDRLVTLDGPTDRCVLYAFRAAHYYVTTADTGLDPELLLWWNWKDAR
jgi:hypothetical protein